MNDEENCKKAVFDTGIVLQAILSDAGPSFGCLRLLEEGKIIVLLSPQVREEYEKVITRPSIIKKNPALTAERAQILLSMLDAKMRLVTVIKSYLEFPRDRND